MRQNYYPSKKRRVAAKRNLFLFFCTALWLLVFSGTNVQAQRCDSNSPYDQIQSSFHSTVVTRVDGMFLCWGERSAPNGTANNLSPLEVTPANGYAYTGSLRDISLSSNSSNNAQFFLLTTTGLYAWGSTDIAIPTTLKNTTAFGSILMPVGVAATDIKKMLATRDALLLLTNTGEVWIASRNANMFGTGGVVPGAGANYWAQVTISTGANPVLTNVVDVRISPAGAFAYTSVGEYYTWGPNVFLGNGSPAGAVNRATLMQAPFAGTPKMIAMTAGVTGGVRQASYYAINPADGRIYATGNNTNGQLGRGNNTSQTGWVNVRNSGNTADITNATFISGNDQDGWSTSTGAVSFITSDKRLWGLGSNQGTMIGGATNNADYNLPIVPAGFTFGTDNPFYVEVGGHTSVYVKECSDRYCYVGHRISGSMGDGTNTSQFEPSFNCTYTAASVICGASTFDAGDAPVSYNNATATNHYYMCMDSLYLGNIPPKPNNGLASVSVAVDADNNLAVGGDILLGLEEDGIATFPTYTGGTTYTLSVRALNIMGSTANLYAWVDWNNNGVFEASEFASQTYASMAGRQNKNVTWTVNPSTVTCGRKYVRLRLTMDALTDNAGTTNIDERSFGTANNGEIEDFNITATVPTSAGADIYADFHNPLPSGSVTMAGTGVGVWTASVTNPGTATITTPSSVTTTITNFSAPGVYTFIFRSGTGTLSCADSMEVRFNVKPVANNDIASTNEDVPVVINVPGNDTDTEGLLANNTVTVIGGPANGTVNVNPANGQVTYTPAPGYDGPDSFTYRICDNPPAPFVSQCDTATVSITVNPVNHPPVANNDNATTPEDTPVTVNVSANDTDPDGNLVPSTVAVIPGGGPNHGTYTLNGTGGIVYTPNTNYNGNDTIVYTICDNGVPAPAYCDTATLYITITPVNDPPVINMPPATTPEDTPVTVCSPITDPDAGNTFTASVCGGPVHGTITGPTVSGGQVCVNYTPNLDYNGLDSVCIIVCDQAGLCDTSTAVITVTPVNDPPIANNDNNTTAEDTPVNGNVSTNDNPTDGPGASYGLVNAPVNGTVVLNGDGTYTYTPNANYNGTDVFTYSLCDGGTPNLCDTATVTISITPVNDAPVVNADNATTNEDTPVVINVIANDTDVDGVIVPNSVAMVTQPANGSVTINAATGEITYTPNPNFNGTDSFIYLACDNGTPLPSLCDTAVVTVTVLPVNDPPVANNDNITTPEDTPVNGDVSTNDDATDGPGETYALVNGPSNGTLTFNNDGTYTYTPNTNYNGTDVFTYSICDGAVPNLCDTATVTINITPVNDPPVIDLSPVTTPEDTPVTICSPITDPDAGNTFTATRCGGPTNGTISGPTVFNGQVCVTYTPNLNYNGLDSVCIIVCDQNGLCDTSTTVITVTPVNDPPVANNDNISTPEDTPVNGDVSTNDDATDGPGETYALVGGPANGTLTFNNDGTYTYTPNTNYNGTDVFTYSICDGAVPNLCDTATVTINITPVNDPPVIDLPPVTTPEDTPVTVCSPITDPDAGNTFTATVCGGPNNGTMTGPTVFNGQVCVTYTPTLNYNGLDSICIVVCDQNGLCDTSTTVITVTPVNDPPVANNDNISTPEDTPVNGDVSTNDDATDGPGETYALVNGPGNGTLTFNNDGTYTYTPNTNYNGTDVFTYSLCDGGTPNLCDTATVTITVLPVNDAPIVNADNATTNEDTPVVINVIANDTDVDGVIVPNTVAPVTQPANGTITVNASTGAITYTPNPNFNGTDSFIYIACDNGTPLPSLCDTAVVTINVLPVNDPPVANNDINNTNEDTPVNGDVSTNDDLTDGPGETYTLVNGPGNGTLTFNNDGTYTYTPNTNYNGTDVFTYSLCDGGTPNLCDTATVTITVLPVNDAPIVNADNATTNEDTPVVINVISNDTDVDGVIVPNTVAPVTLPANGTITVNASTGAITYTPNPNFNGTDSFIYIACDNGTPLPSLCDTAVVTINVLPVNDAPVANNDNATTPEDTPVVINVPGNDTDVDGNIDSTSVTVSTPPTHGTVTIDPVTGVVTYTPDPNYNGPDVFTYSICDTGMPVYCDTATVTINVTPVNDPPVIDLPPVTTPEDTPVTICSPITDPDANNTFTATVCGGPNNGTITGPTVFNGQVCVTYTPSLNYNGLDSVCIIVCDQGGLCDTSTTVITITPVNDPPVANNDTNSTNEDTPVNGDVSTNDNDTDGPGETYTLVNGPGNGTLTFNNDGTYTYTPNTNYNGTDVFTYSLCDGGTPNLCDTATVTINVLPVNDAPIVNADNATTNEDTPVVINVIANDTDVDGVIVPNTVAPVTLPANGTITVNASTGAITYTPNPNFNGTDSFIYIACDNGTPLPSLCDTAVVTINVLPMNDAPVANNDNATTPEDTPVVINVPGNDTDVDGNIDSTSVTVSTPPTHGTVTIDPVTGVVTYTPDPNYNGPDVFTYSICDTGMPVYCDTATVTINVTPVNDPPVINLPPVTTPEDTPVTICSPITDPDANNTFTASVCGGPNNGTITGPTVFNGQVCVTYTPSLNYNGLDSVCIIVCDQGGLCDTSTTVITVTPVNDPPVANNNNATTPEDTPVVINVPGNDTDVDGNLDLTSVTVSTPPSHGTVTIDPATGVVTYTPDPNYNGPDVFTYSICDTGMPVYCDTATVTINVTPVNDPPVINLPPATTPEDTPVTVCSPITDPDFGDVFTATLCGGPYNGTVSGPTVFNGQVCVTYTPTLNYNGLDSICVIVCDQNGLCDTSTTVITVTPVNDPPTANDDVATTNTGTPVTVPVLGNDTDPDDGLDSTSVVIATPPTQGTVTVNGDGTVTYTPNANACGTDTFVYQVCDNGVPAPSLCDQATVTITIVDTQAPAIVCPANVSVSNTTGRCGYVMAGTALDATATDNCSAVTLTHNYYAWGNPSSLQGATFPVGTTTVQWTATDAFGNTSTCSVNITVTDDEAPSFLNCQNGAVYTVGLFSGDCEGSTIWATPVAADNCSAVSVTQTAGPAPGSILTVGTYVITYTATDGAGNTDSCSFTLNVVDTEMPTIACPGNVFQATTDAGVCAWTSPAASLTPLMVHSNCTSTLAWQVTNPDATTATGTGDVSGYTFALGTSTVTYTVTETASGQTISCSFTVTVTDDEAPVFAGCPSDITVANAAGSCNAAVTWAAPTATDNCSVTVTSTHNSGDVFPVGTTTVTYTATDAAGNVSTCSFDVTVNDTELPVFAACPTNINVSNDAGVCGAAVTWTAPTATDNCGVSVTSTHNSGDVFTIGTTTVTYTATDAAGNVATCTFDVTVTDDEAPTVTNCPSDITVTNLYNTCYQQVYWPAITATDNCGNTGITITSSHQPGYVFPLGTTLVTYVVTDATGNADSCSFNVTVQDTQRPTIQGCPINMTVQNDAGVCGAVVTWVEPSVFDNCSGVSVSSTHNSGTTFPVGTTTVTYTVVDGAGNADSCSFTVTVVDKEVPAITGCPANISVGTGAGICGANVTWTAPGITDNCPGVTFTSSHNSGDLFPIGATTVTYTATDAAGNVSTCSFTVTVADMQAPSITGCPADITVGNDAGICGASVTWTAPVITDNCGAPVVTSTHASGAVFPVGTTTVTYTATDAAGNVSTCSFNVTVNEVEAPVIGNCPGNITVNNNFNVCGATVIWAVPTVTDNCGAPTVTATHTPGTVFPIGTTTVTYVATDASGNSDTCSFTVTVNDTQAPQITGCPENISLPALTGSCQNQAFWTAPSALDNCPGVTMTGSHTSGSNFPVGVTTVTYTATDASGNVTVCSFTVTITDNVAPVTANCPANINTTTDAGICGAAVTWTAPVFTDNCGTPTVTSTHNSGDVFPVGTTTVTYTATDVAGNSTTCSFNITVADDEAPVIAGCPANISVSTDAGICGATVSWTAPTATDNCAIVGFTGNHAPGTVFPVGTTTVTYTATDAAGNTTLCTFNVTVTDNVLPTVSNCPANITLNAAFNTCGAPVMWAAPTFTDNCSGLTVTTTHLPGTTFPVGTTTVTYTTTDVSGNAVTCSFDITVNDVQVPVISACPIDMTVTNNPGICGAAVNWVLPTAFDNCSGTTFTTTHAPGSVFPVGTTTVTYTATDASGNTATCSFNVTVLDKEAPVITNCPANVTVSNDAGICGASVSWTAPVANDNCGVQTFTSTHNIGDVLPVGTTTVVYTAVDTAGNESKCSFTVTVNDTEAPVIAACPSDINGCSSSPITWTAPTATDNCGSVTVVSTHNPGDIFPIGVTTVTYTVTDAAGNVSTCSFDVSIYEPRLTVVKTDVTCNGMNDGTATVTVNGSVGPFTFNWGAQGTDSLITNLAPGTYGVTVTDIFGCSASDTVTITEPEVFKVALGTVQHATCGYTDGSAEVKVEGGTLAYAFQWSDGQTTQSLYNAADGVYKLVATDANGCQDSLTVTITCEFGKVPQLLSPNGDGHNDTWVIPGIDKYPDAVVEVYNRWGNLVYKATPYLNDWAGISKGLLTVGKDRLPAGTYFYVITLTKGAKAMTGYIELQY